MTYRKKQRTSTVLPRLTPLSLRPSALVNEQVSMHYERSDQVGRAGRRQRRDVAMVAAVAEEGSKEGGQSCNRDATRIHTHGGVSGRRQSKSESEVSSVVVVVSTAVGQTGSSQGLHSRILARVKQAKLYAPAFSITDHSVDSHNLLLLLLFDLAG